MTAPRQMEFIAAELVAMGILDGLTLGNIAVEVVQSTSLNLTPPLVRVRRVPGEPRTHFDDPAHVEYNAFGATFGQASALAEECWRRFEFAFATGVPVLDTDGAPDGRTIVIDHTATVLAPAEVPYPNPDVRLFQGVHLIVTRAIPAL